MDNNEVTKNKSNKAVTVISALACVASVGVGFYYRTSIETTTIEVPYTKVSIPARSKISDYMLGKLNVPASFVKKNENVVENSSDIIDKYVSAQTDIPKGSVIFKSQIVEEEGIPNYFIKKVNDNEKVFALSMTSDYKLTEVKVGDFVDLNYKVGTESGVFISNLRILGMKDANGNNLTNNKDNKAVMLLFTVPEYVYQLLQMTKVKELGITLTPSISSKQDDPQTMIESIYLEDYIHENMSLVIGDEE